MEDRLGARIIAKQALVGVVAVMGAVCSGGSLAFSAVALPQLQDAEDRLDAEQASWFASVASMSTPVGCVVSGLLLDRLGRRAVLLMLQPPFIAGWLLLAFCPWPASESAAQLYAGRLLTGLATGLASVPATVYLGETAPGRLRAALVTWTSLSISGGILLAYVLGAALPWRLAAGAWGALPGAALLLTLWLLPESPAWLARRGRLAAAEAALRRLRAQPPAGALPPAVADELRQLCRLCPAGADSQYPQHGPTQQPPQCTSVCLPADSQHPPDTEQGFAHYHKHVKSGISDGGFTPSGCYTAHTLETSAESETSNDFQKEVHDSAGSTITDTDSSIVAYQNLAFQDDESMMSDSTNLPSNMACIKKTTETHTQNLHQKSHEEDMNVNKVVANSNVDTSLCNNNGFPEKIINGTIEINKKTESPHEERRAAKLLAMARDRAVWRPLLLLNAYFLFMQLAGVYVVVSYAVDIVCDAGVAIDAYVAAVVLGAVQFASSIIVSYVVTRCGRRPLSIISGLGMTLCMLGLALYLQFAELPPTVDSPAAVAPLILMVLYVVSGAVGFHTLPWALLGEVFPSYARGPAAGATTCLAYLENFAALKLYPSLAASLSSDRGDGLWTSRNVFLFFSGTSLIGTLFLLLFLPETRGYSLQDIEENFRHGKALQICKRKQIREQKEVTGT